MFKLKKAHREITSHVRYRREIDGLRGFAISFVLVQHLAGSYFSFGFLGVDIFFVLSGYVIYNSYFKLPDYSLRIFLFNRFSRLAPGIIGVLICTSLFPSLREMTQAGDFIRVLLLVKNFDNWDWPLGPLWSLSAEEQFYLLSGLLVAYYRKQFFKITFLKYIVFILLTLQIIGLILSFNSYNFNSPTLFNIVFFRPLQIVLGVLLGVAEKAKLFDNLSFLNIFLHPNLILVYLVAAMYLGSPTLVSLFALCILRVENSKSRLGKFFYRVFSLKSIQEIGVLSYSIYIWHVSVILILPNLDSKPINFLLRIATIYLVSFLSFNFLEMPARRALKRLFSRI